MLTGNKGEWSEFYAFVKLLSDGEIAYAKSDLTPNRSKHLTVKRVVREDLAFEIGDLSVKIINKYRHSYTINRSEIAELAVAFCNEIVRGVGTFNCPSGAILMRMLRQQRLKAPSNKKADLSVQLADPRLTGLPTLDFSIKSYMGSLPTLFNASHATKLVYQIHPVLEDGVVDALKAFANDERDQTETKEYLLELLQNGAIVLEFDHMVDCNCLNNFTLVDSNFAAIYANAVLINYYGKASAISDVCKCLHNDDPLLIDIDHYYEKKITDFLVAVALGLEPAKPWNGIEEANGGYIIVNKDASVVCYNTYDRQEFREYLLKHTKFDTPSARKFLNKGETIEDGILFVADENVYITLNRQIRFC